MSGVVVSSIALGVALPGTYEGAKLDQAMNAPPTLA